MMHWLEAVKRWFVEPQNVPRPIKQDGEDHEKAELNRRLRDAQSRLQRLEWEADVMRRKQNGNTTAEQKKESPS